MLQKAINLYYKITPSAILPPNERDVEAKNRWIETIQKSVEAEWKPLYIKVRYELFNPEIKRQMRFFNGVVVKYYAIQNEGKEVSPERLKQYREEILDELLGYDLKLVTKTVRRRQSTADFKSVQRWNKFLTLVEETIFFDAGYEFPDSEEYWKLVEEVGEEKAEEVLTSRLIKKYGEKQPHRNI